MNNFLQLKNISKHFSIDKKIKVLKNLSYDFKKGKILGYIVRCWAKTIFKTIGIRTEITGLENLDTSKNYIFASNHASSLDIPLLLGFLPFWIVPISKIELKWIPFLGWAMMTNNVIRAEGKPKVAMLTMIIPAISNVILDYLLIYQLYYLINYTF